MKFTVAIDPRERFFSVALWPERRPMLDLFYADRFGLALDWRDRTWPLLGPAARIAWRHQIRSLPEPRSASLHKGSAPGECA